MTRFRHIMHQARHCISRQLTRSLVLNQSLDPAESSKLKCTLTMVWLC